ncbi:MAG: LOG family protein [bacterium]|nr:LOG family protein [bacterium]
MVDSNHDGIPDDIDIEHFRVAIFGSARIKQDDQVYKDVYLLAHALAEEGIDIVTGGGPGLMEAANRGHKIGRPNGADVRSLGLNIRLPHEQKDNRFLDIKRDFDVFSERLDAFMLLSNMVVVAPGGIGTLLELFYTWQLMQVRHTCKMPIILMGDMWCGLVEWIKKYPLKHGLLDKDDIENIAIVDTWEEAETLIINAYKLFQQAGKDFCINLKTYGERAHIDHIL